MTLTRDTKELEYDYDFANIMEKEESAQKSAKRARSQYATSKKTIKTLRKALEEAEFAIDQRNTSLATKEAQLKDFRDREAAMHSREVRSKRTKAQLKTRAAELKRAKAKLKTRAAELEIWADELKTRQAEQKDLQAAEQTRLNETQKGQTLCASTVTGTVYPNDDGEETFEPDASDQESSAPPTKNGKSDETPRSILKNSVRNDIGLLPLINKYVTFDDIRVDTYASIGVEAEKLDGYQTNPTDSLNIEGAELNKLSELNESGRALVPPVEETRLEYSQTALQMDLDKHDSDHALCAGTTTRAENAVMLELDEMWNFIYQGAVYKDFMESGVDFPVNVEAW